MWLLPENVPISALSWELGCWQAPNVPKVHSWRWGGSRTGAVQGTEGLAGVPAFSPVWEWLISLQRKGLSVSMQVR